MLLNTRLRRCGAPRLSCLLAAWPHRAREVPLETSSTYCGNPEEEGTVYESSSTRASQSQIHSQNRRTLSTKLLTFGVFERDFGFDSHEWCRSQAATTAKQRKDNVSPLQG